MNRFTLGAAFLASLLGGLAAACGSSPGDPGGQPHENEVGMVSFAVATVPTSVSCISVQVAQQGPAPAPPVSQAFSVTPGGAWTGSIAIPAPYGTFSVTASAYNVACSSILNAAPTWIAEGVRLYLWPGATPVATLNFHQNLPVQTTANFVSNVASIAQGTYATGFLFADGTVKIVGTGVPQPTSLTGATQLSIGSDHACVLKNDGTVWCWGYNAYGQLGNGTTTSSPSTPVQAPVYGATLIAAGQQTTCASTRWTTYCWGNNANGAIGDGTQTNRSSPAYVYGGGQSAAIATSSQHTCQVKGDGSVNCWGQNAYGELGTGTTTNSLTPVAAGTGRGFVDVVIGPNHSCALDTLGRVYCWGSNWYGQFGTGDTTGSSSTPIQVTSFGQPVSQIVSGWNHVCARTPTFGLSCAGQNSYGQLGDGTGAMQQPTPVVPFPTKPVQSISAGAFFSCAVLTDQTIWCWGDNMYGELGDGTTISRFKPVQIQP